MQLPQDLLHQLSGASTIVILEAQILFLLHSFNGVALNLFTFSLYDNFAAIEHLGINQCIRNFPHIINYNKKFV